ncbi:MAG: hypothetical protein IIC50_25200, partial [Planctomycetes bacterium]|nr:hypothetical protein [Planctomycetota bacterium]
APMPEQGHRASGQIVGFVDEDPIVRFTPMVEEQVPADTILHTDTYKGSMSAKPGGSSASGIVSEEEHLKQSLRMWLENKITPIDETRVTFVEGPYEEGVEYLKMTISYRVFPQDRMRSA